MRDLADKLDRFIFADLLFTAVCAPLAFGTVEPWSLALFELNALLLLPALAVRLSANDFGAWRGLRLTLPLAALLLLGLMQIVPFKPTDPATLSLDPHATREALAKLLALTIYFAAALVTLQAESRRRIVFITLTAFGFVMAVFAIVQRLSWNGKLYWLRPVSEHVAPFGPYANYNHFAGLMELLLPLPFAHLLLARLDAQRRALLLFPTVFMAAALIFSLSRGGLLAFGVELTALLLIWRRKRDRDARVTPPLLIGFALAAIAALTLWIGYDRLTARFQTLRQGAGEYSVVARVEFWRASWRMFVDHPVAGVGLGAFPAIYPSYGRASANLERLEQVHNDYLQLLTDAGVLGGLIGLWFLFELLRAARQQWRRLPALHSGERATIIGGRVAVLGLLVHSCFDFNLQIAANALLFLVAVALAVSSARD